MGIDYLAPTPLAPAAPAPSAPIPAGPPMGMPAPGAPPPTNSPPTVPPQVIAALLAAKAHAPSTNAGGPAVMPAMGGPLGPPNGIPGATGPGAAPYPTVPTPGSMKYTNVTQTDGTVLLRVLNPDGSPGPVVQIVKPPTAKGGK